MSKTKLKNIEIGGVEIAPGERRKLSIDVVPLYDFTNMTIPVEVIRGMQEGPILFISAAVHGDEINGVKIINRLLRLKAIKKIKGTLIVVPIVNVFGFTSRSRYLPDRRDLNRSFPGSEEGSLAARLANKFMKEIVRECTHGIDLHTAAIHRNNYPQIRANMGHPEVNKMAHAFGLPVILNSIPPAGAMRGEAEKIGIPVLVYEGGEALRFDAKMVKSGLQGIIGVMRAIGMLSPKGENKGKKKEAAFIAKTSYWVRAYQSGIFSASKKLGTRVNRGEIIGMISDPFGEHELEVTAPRAGIIIGGAVIPLVNEGDALFHIATFHNTGLVEERVGVFEDSLGEE